MEQAVAIVTGAASGIGRGIAEHLAGKGVSVVVADIQDDDGEGVAQHLVEQGGQAMFVHTDVTKKAQVEALVAAAAERFGRLDYLVNNAGVVTMTPFLDLPEQEWDLVLNIDLKGQFLCAQAFSREVIRQQHGGAIVNIGTVESEVVSAGRSSDDASLPSATVHTLSTLPAVAAACVKSREKAKAPTFSAIGPNVRSSLPVASDQSLSVLSPAVSTCAPFE